MSDQPSQFPQYQQYRPGGDQSGLFGQCVYAFLILLVILVLYLVFIDDDVSYVYVTHDVNFRDDGEARANTYVPPNNNQKQLMNFNNIMRKSDASIDVYDVNGGSNDGWNNTMASGVVTPLKPGMSNPGEYRSSCADQMLKTT